MTRPRRLAWGVALCLSWTGAAGTGSDPGFGGSHTAEVGSGSAQQVGHQLVGSIPGPADLVRAHRGHLYVSAGKTLMIYDVSDPAAAELQGSYTFPEEIWGFRLAESRAYVGANFYGLGILDISNPAAPSLVSAHKTLGQTKIGAVFDTKVVLIDHMEGLVMLDLSDETDPVAVGSFFLDGYARDVVTSGSFAYAVDSPTGLYVFDLSRPGPPEPVGVIHAPSAPRFIEASSGAEGLAPRLVCGAGGGNLQVYDVSNPAAPVRAATFRTPGTAQRVALDGALAYVADGREGVQVVDLSAPAAPRLVGSYRTPRPARDVSVGETHVFVVIGATGEDQGEDSEVLILTKPSGS